jgi:hypothetical protein
MALFNGNKETKEEKQAQKVEALLSKFNLNGLTDDADIESVRKIANRLVGTGLSEAGMALSMAKPAEALPVYYLRAIMEQNWIIIRQLDRLNGFFDQLNKK